MPEARYGTSERTGSRASSSTPTRFGADRETIRLALEAEDIEARPLWKPMHLQPVFARTARSAATCRRGLFERGLCLPSGSSLTEDDQDRVVAASWRADEYACPTSRAATQVSDRRRRPCRPTASTPPGRASTRLDDVEPVRTSARRGR